jgi:hypothetical protein
MPHPVERFWLLTTDDEPLEPELALEQAIESGTVLACIAVVDPLVLR